MSVTFDPTDDNFVDDILDYMRGGSLPETGYFAPVGDTGNVFSLDEYIHTDAELLCASNLAYALAELGACEGFHDGEITLLGADGNPTPALLRLAELFNKLADYPILDEDDYSARQCDFVGDHGLELFGDETFEAWRAGQLAHLSGWCGDPDTVPAPNEQPEATCYQELTGDALAFVTGHAQSACLESDYCH